MMSQTPVAHGAMRRFAGASLALGGYLLLTGALFLSPFLLSQNAIANDVFMANLFIAPVYVVLGILLFLGGLLGARGNWRTGWGSSPWQALLLALAGGGVLLLVYALSGSRYYAFGETVSSLPPYLNLPVFLVSLALGAAIFLLGWLWSSR